MDTFEGSTSCEPDTIAAVDRTKVGSFIVQFEMQLIDDRIDASNNKLVCTLKWLVETREVMRIESDEIAKNGAKLIRAKLGITDGTAVLSGSRDGDILELTDGISDG